MRKLRASGVFLMGDASEDDDDETGMTARMIEPTGMKMKRQTTRRVRTRRGRAF